MQIPHIVVKDDGRELPVVITRIEEDARGIWLIEATIATTAPDCTMSIGTAKT